MRDLGRIKSVLMILRDIYLPMKCASDSDEQEQWIGKFRTALEAEHLENGPSAGEAVTNTYSDHTVKVPDGYGRIRSLRCFKIRESANHFNHQFFFIVNFVWDEETSTRYIESFDHGATPTERS